WKGASAIHMAKMRKKHGVDGQIICVDTWLGARGFWVDKPDRRRFQRLESRNGYPSVYYTLLNNVCHTGHQPRIIPLPQTSAIAARLLSGIKADLIHIDGSHDEMDVLDDLWSYWPILRDGGVMFGDDYQPDWPGVVTAVDEFAKSHGVEVDTSENKR